MRLLCATHDAWLRTRTAHDVEQHCRIYAQDCPLSSGYFVQARDQTPTATLNAITDKFGVVRWKGTQHSSLHSMIINVAQSVFRRIANGPFAYSVGLAFVPLVPVSSQFYRLARYLLLDEMTRHDVAMK